MVTGKLDRANEETGDWVIWNDLDFLGDKDQWEGRIRSRAADPAEVLACKLSVMRTSAGDRKGYTLEWSDVKPEPDHRTAVDNMERGVIFLTPEGNVIYRNAQAIKRSLEKDLDMGGRPIWDGLDWRNLREERETLIRLFRMAVQAGETQSLIFRQGRRFSSPERSIIHITMCPVHDVRGTLTQVVMEEWNIPIGVQMEIRTRMTESAFRSFLDQSPLPAWMVDAQGKLIAVSKSYGEIFGLGGDDVGKDMMQLIPSRFVMQYTKHHEKVLNGGEYLHVVENWMGPDGQVRTYIVHKFPIRMGLSITMIGAIAFEVTEKLRMEEEFRDCHERFTLASEATQDLIWDWDIHADSVRTQGDPAVIWSDEEEQVYSSELFFGKMHPDDRLRVEAVVRTALADPSTDRIQDVYRFRIQGGGYVPILDRARILRDEHGIAYRVVGSAMRLGEDQQRIMRLLHARDDKRRDMTETNGMNRKMKWTGGEHLDFAIRRTLAKYDPMGKVTTGISIIGMDKPILQGFDVMPLLTVIGRFFDTIDQAGPVRNLSLYIWPEAGKIWLRAAHDGSADWETYLKDQTKRKTVPGELEDAFTGHGHIVFSFPIEDGQHNQSV